MILFIAAILLGVCPSVLADYAPNLYSENAYLSEEGVFFSQLRVRAGFSATAEISPFLQVGQELWTSQGRIENPDWASSFAYFGPGVQWQLGRFSLIGEARFRRFYAGALQDGSELPAWDGRALLVYGNFLSQALDHQHRWEAFLEPYSETVFTSADSANLIFDGFIRGGLRYRATNKLLLDVYAEPFLSLDRIGHYYYNRVQLRPSVRLQYASGTFAIGIIGSYLANYYFAYANRDPNPYPQASGGIRVLSFIGASL